MSLLKTLLSEGNYLTVSKPLMRSIGLDEAVLLQHLLSLSSSKDWHSEFFQQRERIMSEFNWSAKRVTNTIKSLSTQNILSVIKKGLPAKNYYTINEDVVLNLLDPRWGKNGTTSGAKMEPPVGPKRNHQWGKNGTTKEDKDNNIKEEDKGKKKKAIINKGGNVAKLDNSYYDDLILTELTNYITPAIR